MGQKILLLKLISLMLKTVRQRDMDLCIVTHRVVKGDGQGRANYEIAWEAIRRGHHVTLLSSQAALELQQHPLVTWIPITTEQWPTEFLRNLLFSWESNSWLRTHCHKVDLVQTYGCITSYPGDVNTAQFVHAGWLRSPVHTSKVRRDYYGAYQWLYTSLNALWEKKAFRQAKIAVAVSEQVKQELLSIGVDEQRIKVIFNGVDPQEFYPSPVDRSQVGLPDGVPVAVFAGDIRLNRKNLDSVLYALAQVPSLHLAVVGSVDGSPYPKLAEQLGISDRVHFLGFRHDIADVMRTCDLFVFPSRYEPFGMVVSEAMAVGLPVITAANVGAAEIVTPECGIVIPHSEDIPALAQALKVLADDETLRKRMGKAGQAIAEQHSWVSKAKVYIDLFETLVEESKEPC
jgi:glycosyltransferase involved in cell wall biosynthesis